MLNLWPSLALPSFGGSGLNLGVLRTPLFHFCLVPEEILVTHPSHLPAHSLTTFHPHCSQPLPSVQATVTPVGSPQLGRWRRLPLTYLFSPVLIHSVLIAAASVTLFI